jgi:Ser/Thr protein kinase RdoA (MazF antagonist)
MSFDQLSPDLVLDAIESLGFSCDGRFLTLNSYENRVFQIHLNSQTDPSNHFIAASFAEKSKDKLVAKFYRANRWSDAQIQEEHEFSQELVEFEIPCIAPLQCAGQTLQHFQGQRFSVFECRGGRSANLENLEQLEWIGRFIGRIHSVGRRSSFKFREAISAQTLGFDSIQSLKNLQAIPEALLPAWLSVAEQAMVLVQERWNDLGDIQSIRLHGDMHIGNILWTDAGPHFVDLDDCRQGPPIQDLWLLTANEPEIRDAQLTSLLRGYARFCEFDRTTLQLIEPLRTLRMIQHSAWIAKRWTDPAFVRAFPWFEDLRYWQDRILELREQVGLLQEFQCFDGVS